MITLGFGLVLTLGVGADNAQAAKYVPQTVTNGGTIVGTVKLDATAPAQEVVSITTVEGVCHKDPVLSEKLVVDGDGGVLWAVIKITGIETGKPHPKLASPSEAPSLDQNGCVFSPHVVTIPVGQNLTLLNSDGVLHNVHTWPKKNRAKNIAMPGPLKQLKIKFRRPERIRVTCDVHSWMEGWIIVMDHPYYAVSAAKGQFVLSDVPPGTYTLSLWHETLGQVEQQVTVVSGEEVRADFTLSQ